MEGRPASAKELDQQRSMDSMTPVQQIKGGQGTSKRQDSIISKESTGLGGPTRSTPRREGEGLSVTGPQRLGCARTVPGLGVPAGSTPRMEGKGLSVPGLESGGFPSQGMAGQQQEGLPRLGGDAAPTNLMAGQC